MTSTDDSTVAPRTLIDGCRRNDVVTERTRWTGRSHRAGHRPSGDHSVARWSAPLWFDEAQLALNLIHRAPAALLEPLDGDRPAPLGFLLAVKAVILLRSVRRIRSRAAPAVAFISGVITRVVRAGESEALFAQMGIDCHRHLRVFARSRQLQCRVQAILHRCLHRARRGSRHPARRRLQRDTGGVDCLFDDFGAGCLVLPPVRVCRRRLVRSTGLGGLAAAAQSPPVDPDLGSSVPLLVSLPVRHVVSLRRISQDEYLVSDWSSRFWARAPSSAGRPAVARREILCLFFESRRIRRRRASAPGPGCGSIPPGDRLLRACGSLQARPVFRAFPSHSDGLDARQYPRWQACRCSLLFRLPFSESLKVCE